MSAKAENLCRLMTRSGSQLLVLRIVGRIDEHSDRLALPQDFDRELAAYVRELGFHIPQPQALAQRVAVIARRRAPDDTAAAVEEGLVAERIGVGHCVHLERDKTVRHSAGELLLERFLTDERSLVEAHE